MNILLVHNFYQTKGGEDVVFQNERALLEQNGHCVQSYVVRNNAIDSYGRKLAVSLNTPFSFSAYFRMLKLLSRNRPDIVHVHNYFPLLSPSVFYACRKLNIPVVHTLHNYRSVCPTTFLLVDGEINEKSILSRSWWTIKERVYRNSLFATFVLVCMVELHKAIGTWSKRVDRFIVLTEFSKSKFVDAGWPEKKIAVKSNFIEDPEFRPAVGRQGYALYLGRLSKEKGIDTLLESWEGNAFPLKVVGEGPLMELIRAQENPAIELLGFQEKAQVLKLISEADFVVFPSIWYETFGMVLIEAFACGTPVIGSNLGSIPDIVEDGVTGLLFEPGSARDLRQKSERMIGVDGLAQEMGRRARTVYEQSYTPRSNYRQLMEIYQDAIAASGN